MAIRRPLVLVVLAAAPQTVDFALRFAGTVFLSHLLSKAEFGICVVIGVVLTAAELVGDFGFDKFLIAHPGGDDRRLLAGTHALLLGRGILLAAVMFAAAPWIASVLGAPGQAASVRWCGVILLTGSLANLEVKQVRRRFRYLPEAAAVLLARLAAFAIVYPAARAFGDHRAIIASLFTGSILYVACSHLFARTRYGLSIREWPVLRAALGYGLPLTLNGIGLAANSQLDRAVVGHGLGLEPLALYAVIVNLAFVPISLLSAALGVLSMSVLVGTRTDTGISPHSYVMIVWIFATITAAYSVFVAVTLDLLVPFVFGAGYAVPGSIHLLITMIVWLRLNQGAPTAALLVAGRTRELMVANLTAGGGVLLAALLLPLVPRIETVLECLLAGWIASLGVFFWGARGAVRGGSRDILKSLAWSLLPTAAAGVGIAAVPGQMWWRASVAAAAMIVVFVQALSGFRAHVRPGPVFAAPVSSTAPLGQP